MTKKITSAMMLMSLFMAAFAFSASAQSPTAPETAGGVNGTIVTPTQPIFDPTCVKNAIETRDSAIIAAVDAANIALKSALSIRKDALKAAWDIANRKDRRTALNAAWKAYQEAVRLARKNLRAARLDAWKQFNLNRRQCSGASAAVNDDRTGSGVDANL